MTALRDFCRVDSTSTLKGNPLTGISNCYHNLQQQQPQQEPQQRCTLENSVFVPKSLMKRSLAFLEPLSMLNDDDAAIGVLDGMCIAEVEDGKVLELAEARRKIKERQGMVETASAVSTATTVSVALAAEDEALRSILVLGTAARFLTEQHRREKVVVEKGEKEHHGLRQQKCGVELSFAGDRAKSMGGSRLLFESDEWSQVDKRSGRNDNGEKYTNHTDEYDSTTYTMATTVGVDSPFCTEYEMHRLQRRQRAASVGYETSSTHGLKETREEADSPLFLSVSKSPGVVHNHKPQQEQEHKQQQKTEHLQPCEVKQGGARASVSSVPPIVGARRVCATARVCNEERGSALEYAMGSPPQPHHREHGMWRESPFSTQLKKRSAVKSGLFESSASSFVLFSGKGGSGNESSDRGGTMSVCKRQAWLKSAPTWAIEYAAEGAEADRAAVPRTPARYSSIRNTAPSAKDLPLASYLTMKQSSQPPAELQYLQQASAWASGPVTSTPVESACRQRQQGQEHSCYIARWQQQDGYFTPQQPAQRDEVLLGSCTQHPLALGASLLESQEPARFRPRPAFVPMKVSPTLWRTARLWKKRAASYNICTDNSHGAGWTIGHGISSRTQRPSRMACPYPTGRGDVEWRWIRCDASGCMPKSRDATRQRELAPS